MKEYTEEEQKIIDFALNNSEKFKSLINKDLIEKKSKEIQKVEKSIIKLETKIAEQKEFAKILKSELKSLS